MQLTDFINLNKNEIDRAIAVRCPNIGRITNEERRLWVLNDESLYLWARSVGCRI